jgi:hypothetical protein
VTASEFGHLRRIRPTLLAGTGIGVTAIHHQGHGLTPPQPLLRQDYRRRLDSVCGKYRRRGAGHFGKEYAKVQAIFPIIFNTGAGSAGKKPSGGGNSTPGDKLGTGFHLFKLYHTECQQAIAR